MPRRKAVPLRGEALPVLRSLHSGCDRPSPSEVAQAWRLPDKASDLLWYRPWPCCPESAQAVTDIVALVPHNDPARWEVVSYEEIII